MTDTFEDDEWAPEEWALFDKIMQVNGPEGLHDAIAYLMECQSIRKLIESISDSEIMGSK